jgi:WD40 repeat protein
MRRELLVLADPHSVMHSAIFSPNGKYLAMAGGDKLVHIWGIA